jgi:hypothetical protein
MVILPTIKELQIPILDSFFKAVFKGGRTVKPQYPTATILFLCAFGIFMYGFAESTTESGDNNSKYWLGSWKLNMEYSDGKNVHGVAYNSAKGTYDVKQNIDGTLYSDTKASHYFKDMRLSDNGRCAKGIFITKPHEKVSQVCEICIFENGQFFIGKFKEGTTTWRIIEGRK